MGLVGWGIALIVIGLLLTLTNVFGFIPGAPLLTIGILLVVVGVVLWLVSLPFKAGRSMSRRGH